MTMRLDITHFCRVFVAMGAVITPMFVFAETTIEGSPANSRAEGLTLIPGREEYSLSFLTTSVRISIRSWKSIRDDTVIKQKLDFSCGAAALATLLNGYYGQAVTEADLLNAMSMGDGRASFDDMARALPKFGFRAQGFASNWEQLLRLKVPVVVYVQHRNDAHFSVLRGIGVDTVWLADPSMGNRTFSREQFLAMWKTRSDLEGEFTLEGRLLAVLPEGVNARKNSEFFRKAPVRQTQNALKHLNFRALP